MKAVNNGGITQAVEIIEKIQDAEREKGILGFDEKRIVKMLKMYEVDNWECSKEVYSPVGVKEKKVVACNGLAELLNTLQL